MTKVPIKEAEEVAKNSGLYEKLNHPVLGPFITAWAVCNWKPLYIIICGFNTPLYTIDYVSENYFQLLKNPYLAFYPLLATALYLWLGPLLANVYLSYKHHRTTDREARDKRYELSIKIKEGWRKNSFHIQDDENITDVVRALPESIAEQEMFERDAEERADELFDRGEILANYVESDLTIPKLLWKYHSIIERIKNKWRFRRGLKKALGKKP
jgi:hypothetical protein